MAIEFISTEIDPYIWIIIVVLIIALLFQLFDKFIKGNQVNLGRGGGSKKEGIIKRLWNRFKDWRKKKKDEREFTITHAEPSEFYQHSGIQEVIVHGTNLRQPIQRVRFFRPSLFNPREIRVVGNIYEQTDKSFKVRIDISNYINTRGLFEDSTYGISRILLGWHGISVRLEIGDSLRRTLWPKRIKKNHFIRIVERPQIEIESIEPASINKDKGETTITVKGKYLDVPIRCRLWNGANELKVIKQQYDRKNDKFKIDVDVSHFIDGADSKDGNYFLYINRSREPMRTLSGKLIFLELKEPDKPTISHLEPNEFYQNEGEQTITIHGTNLNRRIHSISLFNNEGQLIIDRKLINNSDKEKLQIKINVSYFNNGKPSKDGRYNIEFKDEFGNKAKLIDALKLKMRPDFIINQIHPRSVAQNEGKTEITLFGHHLKRRFNDIRFVGKKGTLGKKTTIDNAHDTRLTFEVDVSKYRSGKYSDNGEYIIKVDDESGVTHNLTKLTPNLKLILTPAQNFIVTNIDPPSHHQDEGLVTVTVKGDNLNREFSEIYLYSMSDKSKKLQTSRPFDVQKKQFKINVYVSKDLSGIDSVIGMYGLRLDNGSKNNGTNLIEFGNLFHIKPKKKKNRDSNKDKRDISKDSKNFDINIIQPAHKQIFRVGNYINCICNIKEKIQQERIRWKLVGYNWEQFGSYAGFRANIPKGTYTIIAEILDRNSIPIKSCSVDIIIEVPTIEVKSPKYSTKHKIGEVITLFASTQDGTPNKYNQWIWYNDRKKIIEGNNKDIRLSSDTFHEGDNTIYVRAIDKAGNIVEASTSIIIGKNKKNTDKPEGCRIPKAKQLVLVSSASAMVGSVFDYGPSGRSMPEVSIEKIHESITSMYQSISYINKNKELRNIAADVRADGKLPNIKGKRMSFQPLMKYKGMNVFEIYNYCFRLYEVIEKQWFINIKRIKNDVEIVRSKLPESKFSKNHSNMPRGQDFKRFINKTSASDLFAHLAKYNAVWAGNENKYNTVWEKQYCLYVLGIAKFNQLINKICNSKEKGEQIEVIKVKDPKDTSKKDKKKAKEILKKARKHIKRFEEKVSKEGKGEETLDWQDKEVKKIVKDILNRVNNLVEINIKKDLLYENERDKNYIRLCRAIAKEDKTMIGSEMTNSGINNINQYIKETERFLDFLEALENVQ